MEFEELTLVLNAAVVGTKSNPRKQVRFGSKIGVRVIIHIDNTPLEEVRQTCWYSQEEFANMRRRERKIVNRVAEFGDTILDSDPILSIGIESNACRAERRIRARQALSCVLMEQAQQSEVGCLDSELIARIYKMTAQEGAKAAYQRGLRNVAELWRDLTGAGGDHTITTSCDQNNSTAGLSFYTSHPKPPTLVAPLSPKWSPHETAHRWKNHAADDKLKPPIRE